MFKIDKNKFTNFWHIGLFSVSSIFSFVFLFIPRIDLNLGEKRYLVSPFQLAIGKWFINDTVIQSPFLLAFSIWISFFSFVFLAIIIFKNKKFEDLFFCSVLSMVTPLNIIFIKLFIPSSKIINLSYMFFYILISLSSVFFSLGLFGAETVWKIIFKIFTAICIFSIFSVIFYILISGLPAIFELNVINFFTGKNWSPETGNYEILPFLLSTLFSTVCAVLIGAPIGILTAVFLSEFSPKPVALILRSIIKIMSGIPSVVYGFFGMLIIVPTVKFVSFEQTTGDCLLSAIMLLTIMILPVIISVSEDSLRAVPHEIKESALALGDTKTKIIFKITIPSAKGGILNGIFLSLGRVIGETMAIMMIAGNAINMPLPFKSVRFLTTAMALEISYASEFHRKVLMSCGFVLFMFILILNFIFMRIFSNKNSCSQRTNLL